MNLSWKERLKYFLVCLGFVGLIALYVLEIQWFQNAINPGKLIIASMLFGVLLGVLIGKKLSATTKEQIDVIRTYTILIVLLAIFMPLFGSLLNRKLSFKPTITKQYEFFDQRGYAQERFGIIEGEEIDLDGYYTFLVIDGKLKRIRTKRRVFEQAEKGDMVGVPIQRGLFGVELIKLE